MRIIKRMTLFLMLMVLCLSFISCVSEPQGIPIPDISEQDEATAKQLLTQKGLITKITYRYDDSVEEGLVIDTVPAIGSLVQESDVVTIQVSKGPSYYELGDAVGWIGDVDGIDPFSWGDNGTVRTKGFYGPYVEDGYLHIPVYLKCRSQHSLAFYMDFGTASINDTFDKTVPITVIHSSQSIDNHGAKTEFTLKIPLSDLGVKKPTNVYVHTDLTVDGERKTLKMGFDLTW